MWSIVFIVFVIIGIVAGALYFLTWDDDDEGDL